jgi:hypothetical protein
LRKSHVEGLHNLYFSLDIIRINKGRRIRRAGDVARMAHSMNAYRVLVAKRKRRWEDNIKVDLKQVGGGVDWSLS